MDKKDSLKIVIIGHVDHGKSTLIGRLLIDTESIPEEKIEELNRISEELGKETELAYLTDQLKEEREQNITIDTTQIFFSTDTRNYVIIDAPGHVEFIKNMITGASLAEAAVLMVDVDEGIMEQTRRHAYLINMLGLKNIIVVFNKMDLVDYSKERYESVRGELLTFLDGLDIEPLHTIPFSAKVGVNVTEKSKETPWYDGVTLIDALNSLQPEAGSDEKPMRFPVQDVYTVNGDHVIVGKVASGIIKAGQAVTVLPGHEAATVKAIKLFEGTKDYAHEGENIGLVLDGADSIKRGEIIVPKDDAASPTDTFRAHVFWMAKEPLKVNAPITLRCSTQEVECVAEKIERRMNSSTLELLEEDANEITVNEAAIVLFKTKAPVVIEDFSHIEELGRFILEQQFNLQGAGVITADTVK